MAEKELRRLLPIRVTTEMGKVIDSIARRRLTNSSEAARFLLTIGVKHAEEYITEHDRMMYQQALAMEKLEARARREISLRSTIMIIHNALNQLIEDVTHNGNTPENLERYLEFKETIDNSIREIKELVNPVWSSNEPLLRTLLKLNDRHL